MSYKKKNRKNPYYTDIVEDKHFWKFIWHKNKSL